MATVLKIPVLGQSVEEVRILRWFKKEGDPVAKGEPLAEIETDKVNQEWESTEAGVVRRILIPEDAFAPVNAPGVIVGTADEAIDDLLEQNGDAETFAGASASVVEKAVAGNGTVAGNGAAAVVPAASAETVETVFASPRARRAADAFGIEIAALAGRGTGPGGRIQEKDVLAFRDAAPAARAEATPEAAREPKASPLARAVASGAGLDLGQLAGSGMGGRITADDVRQVAAPPLTPAVPASGGSRTVTLTGMRKRVADNIARSVRTAPHVTLHLSADMSEAQRLRAQLLPVIEKATGGIRVSPTDLIVRAAAQALKEFPYVNAHIEGDALTLFDDVHIGLAVSLGEEGLIVPVIRDAGAKGLAEIARARQDLATRARSGKLTGDDLAGGTFTVSNLGGFGIEHFNPIIAPPQVAILGVGAIADAVVAVDGAPAVRPMMGLSLSFDHRAMDGAPAGAFLQRVKEILENPFLLLA